MSPYPSAPSSLRPVVQSTCEHGWRTESAHVTSDGLVRYVRCVGCGARRVDLQPRVTTPPAALSAPLRPAGPS